MHSLYQLTAELEAMRLKLIENGADEQTIADTLDGEALDFDNKILACAYAKKDLEAIAEGRKEAVREMQESLRATERQIERLDEYMITAMLTVDRLNIPESISMLMLRAKPSRSLSTIRHQYHRFIIGRRSRKPLPLLLTKRLLPTLSNRGRSYPVQSWITGKGW